MSCERRKKIAQRKSAVSCGGDRLISVSKFAWFQAKEGKKTPPPVPCESSFGNPLKNWVPLGWVTDPATVAPTSGADGLVCATRIKIKAPKAS